MKIERWLFVLTGLNLVLLVALLVQWQPASAQSTAPVLRGRALEIIDDQGRVRASIGLLPADRGVILTIEVDGTLEPQIVRFRDEIRRGELTISKTIVQKCLEQRVAILSRDAKIDARFNASDRRDQSGRRLYGEADRAASLSPHRCLP